MAIGTVLMPPMTFSLVASAAVGALVTAPLYHPLALKVGKRRVLMLHSVARGLINVTMGFAHTLIVIPPLGLIGETLMWAPAAYRSLALNTVAWSVYFGGIHRLHGAMLLWASGSQFFSPGPAACSPRSS